MARPQIRWFILDREGQVDRMLKTGPPDTRRGETVLKVNFTVEPGALNPPILERSVTVANWRDGQEILADINLAQLTITEEEAQLIRDRRTAQMVAELTRKGYKIESPEPEEA